jgi:hypothetical protein
MIGVRAQIGLGRKDDISQRHFVSPVKSRRSQVIVFVRAYSTSEGAEISLAIFIRSVGVSFGVFGTERNTIPFA